MLCKCHSIVLYTVHFTAFCLGGPFFPGHGVVAMVNSCNYEIMFVIPMCIKPLSVKCVYTYTF